VTEAELLDFAKAAFRSVWPMELLLLLSQEPRQVWHVEELARELRASREVITQGLKALTAVGFVAFADQGYCFQTKSAELSAVAIELLELYNLKPRAVARAIFSTPADRIQTFADAFRLRKDPC
jgi:DNA-binding IclR family transcriptional regulator